MKNEIITIGDVCEFIGGSQPPKSTFKYEASDGYVRLIQTRDYKTEAFPTYIPASSTRKFCSKDDIMIGRYGPPIFQICRGLEGAYNVALMKAIPKDGVSKLYLYYLLKQPAILEYVERLSLRTGGQTGVDLVSLRNYPVKCTSKFQQSKIERVLGDIDEKISVNDQINKQLAGTCKLLFDYWFVQFDFPCLASEEVSSDEIEHNMLPYRASGGRMAYSDVLNRKIPIGWKVATLSEFATIVMGQSPPGASYNQANNGMVFFQGSTDFGWRFPTVREFTTEPSRFAKEGDVLLSVRAPVGAVNIADRDCCIGRGLAALRAKSGHNAFLFEVMRHLKQIFDLRNASGTTFGSITKDDLYSLRFVCPPNESELLNLFEKKSAPLHACIVNNHRQNLQLASLRDWLLPMLMSGQVTVE